MAGVHKAGALHMIAVGHQHLFFTGSEYFCFNASPIGFAEGRNLEHIAFILLQQPSTVELPSPDRQKFPLNNSGNMSMLLAGITIVKDPYFVFIRNKFLHEEVNRRLPQVGRQFCGCFQFFDGHPLHTDIRFANQRKAKPSCSIC